MTTDKQQWQQLNELLARALEQPESEREAWVEATLRDQPELQAELLELLKYDAEETGGLSSSIARASARATESVIGTSIGSYKITDKIAEGGMGVVYEGQREGADFDQRVAVKVMHSHRFDAVASARFVAERQILATLNHPNIAHLVDGGVTADGLPYIVMEYIDGENIADYCARNKLDNEQILKLVIKVCDALQYAHNQLVIHRDIKPSNILVDANGAPRLLDFGIAKLLEQDGSEGEQTRAEWRIMTPLYASPEQLGSQPVSTASDVYGVGLLLYRLLTGRLPYTPTSDHPRDVESAILSSPAEPPSSAVTRADGSASETWIQRQKKALRGDLDTILLTALRKEPERRYATVDALAEDLDRFLKQLPIRARGDSLGYRASKFVARNRLPVALTALLVGSAIGLTTFYTARINTEREVAEQTADFLAGIFTDSNPYRRSRESLTVAELVTSGAEKIADDDTLQPLVRARLLTIIADVLNTVGDADQAEPLIIEALAIYEGTGPSADRMAAYRKISDTRLLQGRYEDALEALERARAMARDVEGMRSISEAAHACGAAYVHYRIGDYDAMYEAASFSLEVHEEHLEPDDRRMHCPLTTLENYYQTVGQPREALKYAERVDEIMKKNEGPYSIRRASGLQNIGITYTDLGEFSKALEYIELSYEIRQRTTDGTDFQLPLVMYSMAHVTGKLGRFGDAHRLFNELMIVQIEQTGDTHDTVAYWLNGHGDLLANMGATVLADRAFTRATEIYTIIEKPEGHFDRSVTLVGLGKVARDRGDLETAERLMAEGLEIRSKTISESHSFTQLARVDLAEVIRRQGRLDDARATFDQAIENLREGGDGEHPTVAQAYTGLAQIAIAEGDTGSAIELLEQAIAMTEASIGADHLDNVDRRLLIADALEASGDGEAASAVRAPAMAIRTEIMADWNAAIAEESVGP